jgi:hypothetical protein
MNSDEYVLLKESENLREHSLPYGGSKYGLYTLFGYQKGIQALTWSRLVVR